MIQEIFRQVVDGISLLTIPVLFFAIIAAGMLKRVRVYENFVAGGKEGFDVFLRILPYLVAIFVAIGMFRVSGALEYLTDALQPVSYRIGLPAECVPVALMKPLSGSGALAMASEVINKAGIVHNPSADTVYAANVASTIFGSADTTFYIIAVYFGSVSIRKIRHAMLVGLIADLAGILGATWICHVVFK